MYISKYTLYYILKYIFRPKFKLHCITTLNSRLLKRLALQTSPKRAHRLHSASLFLFFSSLSLRVSPPHLTTPHRTRSLTAAFSSFSLTLGIPLSHYIYIFCIYCHKSVFALSFSCIKIKTCQFSTPKLRLVSFIYLTIYIYCNLKDWLFFFLADFKVS